MIRNILKVFETHFPQTGPSLSTSNNFQQTDDNEFEIFTIEKQQRQQQQQQQSSIIIRQFKNPQHQQNTTRMNTLRQIALRKISTPNQTHNNNNLYNCYSQPFIDKILFSTLSGYSTCFVPQDGYCDDDDHDDDNNKTSDDDSCFNKSFEVSDKFILTPTILLHILHQPVTHVVQQHQQQQGGNNNNDVTSSSSSPLVLIIVADNDEEENKNSRAENIVSRFNNLAEERFGVSARNLATTSVETRRRQRSGKNIFFAEQVIVGTFSQMIGFLNSMRRNNLQTQQRISFIWFDQFDLILRQQQQTNNTNNTNSTNQVAAQLIPFLAQQAQNQLQQQQQNSSATPEIATPQLVFSCLATPNDETVCQTMIALNENQFDLPVLFCRRIPIATTTTTNNTTISDQQQSEINQHPDRSLLFWNIDTSDTNNFDENRFKKELMGKILGTRGASFNAVKNYSVFRNSSSSNLRTIGELVLNGLVSRPSCANFAVVIEFQTLEARNQCYRLFSGKKAIFENANSLLNGVVVCPLLENVFDNISLFSCFFLQKVLPTTVILRNAVPSIASVSPNPSLSETGKQVESEILHKLSNNNNNNKFTNLSFHWWIVQHHQTSATRDCLQKSKDDSSYEFHDEVRVAIQFQTFAQFCRFLKHKEALFGDHDPAELISFKLVNSTKRQVVGHYNNNYSMKNNSNLISPNSETDPELDADILALESDL